MEKFDGPAGLSENSVTSSGGNTTSHWHNQTSSVWGPRTDGVTKVVVLAYFRSGSSLLGEIINHYKGAFYVFEPLRGLTKALYGPHKGLGVRFD